MSLLSGRLQILSAPTYRLSPSELLSRILPYKSRDVVDSNERGRQMPLYHTLGAVQYDCAVALGVHPVNNRFTP